MATFRVRLLDKSTGSTYLLENINNWDSIIKELVYSEFTRTPNRVLLNELRFSGEEAKVINMIYDNYGVDADVTAEIFIGNDSGWDGSYKTYGAPFKCDFKTLKRTQTYTAISLIDTDFAEKINNRKENEIKYTNLKTIDGATIKPFSKEYISTTMHPRKLLETGFYNKPYGNNADFQVNKFPIKYRKDNFVIPEMRLANSDSSSILGTYSTNVIQSDTFDDFDWEANSYLAFFDSLGVEKTITVDINMKWHIYMPVNYWGIPASYMFGVKYPPNAYSISIFAFKDNSSTVYELKQYVYDNPSGNSFQIPTNWEFETISTDTITVPAGYKLMAVWWVGRADPENPGNLVFQTMAKEGDFGVEVSGTMNIIAEIGNATTTGNAVLPHEAFTRVLQQITDEEKPLYSKFFGRTDSQPRSYEQDGKGSLVAIANGLMIRGFKFEDSTLDDVITANLKYSFKKLFDGYNSIYNLGMRYITFDGRPTVMIEPIEDLYNINNVIMEITQFDNLVIEIDDDMMWDKVKVGCANFEYEYINGVKEYNSTHNYTIPLKSISNELDLVAELRYDCYGIEEARRKQASKFGTTDMQLDNELFLIAMRRDNGNIIPQKNENYTTVTGIYSPESAYNLALSPKESLINWGVILNSNLWKKSNAKISFQSAEKNYKLSKTTTTGTVIAEGVDIEQKDLKRAIFLPERINFETYLTEEQMQLIESNLDGILKIGQYYGFVKSLKHNKANLKAEVTLRRANR